MWVDSSGKEFSRSEDMYGFIYRIDYTNGKSYIGKKAYTSKVTLKALKSGELREGCTRINKNIKVYGECKAVRTPFDVCIKESDWRNYVGSYKVPEGEESLEIESKVVLLESISNRQLTYDEADALFCHRAIIDDDFINANILGKFYRGGVE